MLGLAEEDTTGSHTFHEEIMYLLGQGRIRSQITVDWDIENPSIGQTTESTTEKVEHLPGEGLEYNHANDLRTICKHCRDNGDDDLSAGLATTQGIRDSLTDDFPSPMFNCTTAFFPELGASISLAISA